MNKKYYLSGIDWIVNALDYSTKKKTGCGNLSQLVLELDRLIDPKDLESKLTKFLEKFPVLDGKVARDFNLAPYWKIPRQKSSYKLPFAYFDLADETNLLESFAKCFEYLNFHKKTYLYFLLISTKEKSFLVFTFDHRLFDAYGAERFLFLFQKFLTGESVNVIGFKPQGPFLEKWKDKFLSGQRINRVFLNLAQGSGVKVLDLPKQLEYHNSRFEIISFDNLQSQKILDNANEKAGYLMTMPYLLAVTLQAMAKAFKEKNIKEDTFIVPVSMDTRLKDKIDEKVFFNHLAFIMLKIDDNQIKDTQILLDTIKKQFYEQVKCNVAKDMQQASMLTRIMPLSLIGIFLGVHLKGKNASLGFSFIGEGAFKADKFMHANVLNLFHMPLVPVPPGVGVFLNQYNGKISLTLSYIKDIFTQNQVKQLIEDIKSNLLL